MSWFLSPDPVSEYYNPYSYCANDPVNKIDPYGENPAVIAIVKVALRVLKEVLKGTPTNVGENQVLQDFEYERRYNDFIGPRDELNLDLGDFSPSPDVTGTGGDGRP